MDDTPEEQQAETPPKLDGADLRRYAEKWADRIKKSEKREDKWREDAKRAEAAYSCDTTVADAKQYDFNILHSNVETIVPAIYNSSPIPDIRRRRLEATGPEPVAPKPPQPDPQTGQVDPQAVQQFQQAMPQYQAAAQDYAAKKQRDTDAKLFGDMLERAITVQVDDNRLDAEMEAAAQDTFVAGRGVVRVRLEGEYGKSERLTFEAVSWRDFRMGACTRWDRCPWVAFKLPMTCDEIEAMADEALLEAQNDAYEKSEEDDEEKTVWEIWDKSKGEVLFIEDGGRLLKRVSDPLGWPGFFPIPQPIQPITKVGSMLPVCPFVVYQKLADELDAITKRINRIMKGLKVRGLIAGSASGLSALADADDNEIKVEPDLESLAQTGGLDKAIIWWPVEQGIKVLSQLYEQRESIKASIYEITGISDIVRGASNAGETATAQQIKTQWGSLRIQKMQRMVERQARDLFVICPHIISSKFSVETLVHMTGLELTPGVQEIMAQPLDAAYRVDVESDSTVRADLTRQKQDMTEFMTGTANFFASMAPVVQQAPEMAEPLSEIYAAAARFYKLGKGPEDALDRMTAISKKAASTPQPNPEVEKAKAEMSLKADELKGKAIIEGEKLKLEERKIELEEKKALADNGFRAREMGARENENGDIESETQQMENAIMRALQAMTEAQMQQNQAMMNELGQLVQGNRMIAAAVTAPKKTDFIIDPSTGKPTGAIQTPMINQPMVN